MVEGERGGRSREGARRQWWRNVANAAAGNARGEMRRPRSSHKDDANVMKARTVGEESGSNGAGRKRTEIQEEETENQERSRTGVQGRMHANSWSRTQVQERTGRNPTSEGAVKISRGGIECCVVWTVCVENVLNAWD